MEERKHVYERMGLWYHDDETDGENGPFVTEADALEALAIYAQALEGPTPEAQANRYAELLRRVPQQ